MINIAIKPSKIFTDIDSWDRLAEEEKISIVEHRGLEIIYSHSYVINASDGYCAFISANTKESYENYGLFLLKDILHDYLLEEFSEIHNSTIKPDYYHNYKKILEYFKIPTKKSLYRAIYSPVTRCRSVYYSDGSYIGTIP